jgi:glyoxylase-like metal-dependent hydrolase (beta-lactamase superfamily II)
MVLQGRPCWRRQNYLLNPASARRTPIASPRLLGWLFAAGLFIFSAWSVGAQSAILPAPVQVSAHAWAWIGPFDGPAKHNNGFRMNLGFVIGRDAVVVIDTGYTKAMAEEMVLAIRRVTPLPIRYAINTNSQPHRFMGNDVFRQLGARVIASKEAVERMAKDGGDFTQAVAMALELQDKPALPAPPNHLIAEKGVEHIDLGGGVTIEIMHVGRTHTGGSLVARVAPDRTVFAGDVLYAGRLPAILPDSNVTGWIAGFERLRGIDAAVFIPGHGQPAPLAAFEQPTLAYLKALKSHMDAAFKAGLDPSAAVRRFDASPWRQLVNFTELSDRNAALAYLESEREGF